MQGNDHFAAAEPDYLKTVKEQSNAIYYTIMEMNDPTLEEAWDRLEEAIAHYEKVHSEQHQRGPEP